MPLIGKDCNGKYGRWSNIDVCYNSHNYFSSQKIMKLDVKAFGLSCGILWAIGYAVLVVLTMTHGYASAIVNVLNTVYVGSGASLQGIAIGAVWAFLDAGIGGALFAMLYNKLAK
ncbi:MAG: bacteriophage holin [Candidatus Peribacteraceae bacterium]|jgi:hypothetical protein|nr:bacteriophage holin [Candidatus Peribacteraceae bacterium]